MSTTDVQINELAEKGAAWFQTAERANGDKYDRLRDGAPQWIQDAVFAAHKSGDILPDDYIHAYVRQAFDYMADSGAERDASDLDSGFADGVDVYTSDLLAWLGSHSSRLGYCDAAAEEYGGELASITDRIMQGQYLERETVFRVVREAIEAQQSSAAAS